MRGSLWWLSFADPDKPTGSQFLGAAIVGPAASLVDAVRCAHVMGCNPGGECRGVEFPPGAEAHVLSQEMHMLMDRDQCAAFDAALAARRTRVAN